MTDCEHPWAAQDEFGGYCQACGVRWHLVFEQRKQTEVHSMPEQAPNIDVINGAGKLIYDKERKTIVASEPDKTKMLRDALAPFAAIGGLVAMGDLPDETVACYMRLDGLTALEFREAYKAFLATNPK